jgi:hypothetical protein
MKVDSLAVWFPNGTKTFNTGRQDRLADESTVEECGVDFHDNGSARPYIRDKGEAAVFVGFPFYYAIKEQHRYR